MAEPKSDIQTVEEYLAEGFAHDENEAYAAFQRIRARLEQAPPAAAVSADTERLLFLQKFLLDLGEVEYNTEKGCMCGGCWAFNLSGGGIDVEGETLLQAIDRAMLAASERKGVES